MATLTRRRPTGLVPWPVLVAVGCPPNGSPQTDSVSAMTAFGELPVVSRESIRQYVYKDAAEVVVKPGVRFNFSVADHIRRFTRSDPEGFNARLSHILQESYRAYRAIERYFFHGLSPQEIRQIVVLQLGCNITIFDVVWRTLRQQNKAAFRAYEARLRRQMELSETEDDATSRAHESPHIAGSKRRRLSPAA